MPERGVNCRCAGPVYTTPLLQPGRPVAVNASGLSSKVVVTVIVTSWRDPAATGATHKATSREPATRQETNKRRIAEPSQTPEYHPIGRQTLRRDVIT